MKHRRVLGVVVLLSAIVTVAVSAALVPWVDGCPLTWDNFVCPPPPDAARHVDVAAIHMTIQWNASYTIRTQLGTSGWCGSVDSLTVTNMMDPAQSWVIESRASSFSLLHEQNHFNLNEVYRRKLELSLQGLQSQGATGDEAQARLNDLLHSTASAILNRLEQMQAEYDEETGHGTDADGQAAWDDQISDWLLDPMSAP
jgi:hypothetical protein